MNTILLYKIPNMSIVEWSKFLYDGALRDYLFTYLSQQKTKQMREVARAIGVTPD